MLSAVALDAFDKLLAKFHFSLNQCFCRDEVNLTIDGLGRKVDTLNDLRTTLLPSIKSQITTFLQSLDLSESPIHICPDPESTAKIVTVLHRTLSKTRNAVEHLALGPPMPSSKNDQHLKDFKKFRIHRILWKTKALIQENLCDLLGSCLLLIEVWDGEEDQRDLEFQEKWALSRNDITRLATKSKLRVDEIIEWSKLSDFAILQDEWRVSARKLTEMLESFTAMLNGEYDSSKGPDENENGVDQVEDKAHRTRALQLAQSGLPLMKLARLFFDKVTKASNQMPFTLVTHFSSENHEFLTEKMNSFYLSVNHVYCELCLIYASDRNIAMGIRKLKEKIEETLRNHDKVLLELAFLLVPSHTTADRPASNSNFKTWFRPMSNLIVLASLNLLEAARNCFPEL